MYIYLLANWYWIKGVLQSHNFSQEIMYIAIGFIVIADTIKAFRERK